MIYKYFSIGYDVEKSIVFRKIIREDIPLNDPKLMKESIEVIKNILIEKQCHRVFTDFSLIDIKMNFDAEYNYAANFKKIFDYPEGTYIAVYLGSFYDQKRWDLFRKILKQHDVTNIEYFGNYEKAIKWLINK